MQHQKSLPVKDSSCWRGLIPSRLVLSNNCFLFNCGSDKPIRRKPLALKAIPIQPDGAVTDAPLKLIRRAELANMLGISRSMTYLKGKPDSRYFDPLFPVPIRIGVRMRCFLLSDVKKYLDALAQQRFAA